MGTDKSRGIIPYAILGNSVWIVDDYGWQWLLITNCCILVADGQYQSCCRHFWFAIIGWMQGKSNPRNKGGFTNIPTYPYRMKPVHHQLSLTLITKHHWSSLTILKPLWTKWADNLHGPTAQGFSRLTLMGQNTHTTLLGSVETRIISTNDWWQQHEWDNNNRIGHDISQWDNNNNTYNEIDNNTSLINATSLGIFVG